MSGEKTHTERGRPGTGEAWNGGGLEANQRDYLLSIQ